MATLSQTSIDKLKTCDPKLQDLCHQAINIMDFSVLEGHRSQDRQNQLLSEGKSKLPYPKSKHNTSPSKAVDIAPYPIDFNNSNRFYLLAGIMLTLAKQQNIKLRWGGDWNNNMIFNDQKFIDLPHFELVE